MVQLYTHQSICLKVKQRHHIFGSQIYESLPVLISFSRCASCALSPCKVCIRNLLCQQECLPSKWTIDSQFFRKRYLESSWDAFKRDTCRCSLPAQSLRILPSSKANIHIKKLWKNTVESAEKPLWYVTDPHHWVQLGLLVIVLEVCSLICLPSDYIKY